MEELIYNNEETPKRRRMRVTYAQKKGYAGTCKLGKDLELRCFTKEQVGDRIQTGELELLGECAEGSKQRGIGKMAVGEELIRIYPEGSNGGFSYKLKGYARVKEGDGVVALLERSYLALILILAAAALLLAGLVVGAVLLFGGKDGASVGAGGANANQANVPDIEGGAVDWAGTQVRDTGGVVQGIAIPGYESITIDANTTKVLVNFQNPSQNQCFFVISLILTDTGEVLYQSKWLEPGKALYEIELTRALEPGTYNAKVKYETYALTSPYGSLNGAEVKIQLIAEEPNA
ncbi:MAG TPA: hypothetical protein P5116_05015 [Eubacteriales bacterium]|nr:hypothetical protein [Clostridia bacterium]HRV73219.1 hypothetical protein [Eubacteriales bacterium]